MKSSLFKKVTYIFFLFLFCSGLYAQTPQKMSYQSVIRNNSGVLVTNINVGIKISILQGNISGTVVYSETHLVLTNTNGLASLEIGGGNVVSGNFATVNWSNGPYFVKTEIDTTGGTNYTISGTSQLLSVPYALLSEKAVKPTYPVSASDDSATSLYMTTRNLWVDDPDILLTVPETGKYLVSFYSQCTNNNTYIIGVDANYDTVGQVRVYNTTSAVELFITFSIWMQYDQYTINTSQRIYDPLNASASFVKNLNAGDVLKLQYRQLAQGNVAAMTGQWGIGNGGINIVKIGD